MIDITAPQSIGAAAATPASPVDSPDYFASHAIITTAQHYQQQQRYTTFIDSSASPPTSGQIVVYAILTLCFFLCTIKTCALGQSRKHYRAHISIRFMFPLACLILALENATLASSGRFFTDTVDDNIWVQIVFVLQALEVPILLIIVFELTYLVHKRRSVNFCGMFFDEGKRVQSIITTPVKSFVLRNMIRILSLFLLTMGIVVNLDLLDDATTVDELAGRAGWWSLFRDDGRTWKERTHLLLSLIPAAILCVVSFYCSYRLWMYGTTNSMVVHSSICNPWFVPFFGTLALAGGQVFNEEWFPMMSNVGLFIYIFCLILLMHEVDKDMDAADDFAVFLESVSRKGDAITVKHFREQRGEEGGNNNYNDEKGFVVPAAVVDEEWKVGTVTRGMEDGGVRGGGGGGGLEDDVVNGMEVEVVSEGTMPRVTSIHSAPAVVERIGDEEEDAEDDDDEGVHSPDEFEDEVDEARRRAAASERSGGQPLSEGSIFTKLGLVW